MNTAFLRRLLDNHSSLALTATLLVIIGGFITFAHPFNQPSPTAQTKPTPTPSVATTIKGKASFKCATPKCLTNFSAYDVVAYTSNNSVAPTAQGPIANDGAFTLYLPTGTYYIKTLPTTSSPAIKVSVSTNTPALTLIISL
jgi:hypothetical protein